MTSVVTGNEEPKIFSSASQPQLPSEEDDAESTIYVPAEMMDNPLGFVIDAGSSVLKLIYRSNIEYTSGRLIKAILNLPPDQGVLHLRSFNMSQVDGVIDFLKDRCDIVLQKENFDSTWWLTGITTQHLKKRLEETFKIKTKLYSEMMALSICFQHLKKMNFAFYDTNVEAVEFARQYCLHFTRRERLGDTTLNATSIETMQTQPLANIDGGDRGASPTAENNSPGQAQQFENSAEKLLFGNNPKKWTDEYRSSNCNVESPILLIHMGSGSGYGLIGEDYKLISIDGLPGGGKTICGLAEQLTGEGNFHNFIKMAERGQMENVHLRLLNVIDHCRSEDDWYAELPKETVISELGKLATSNLTEKGTYSKEDLAFGLLDASAKNLAKMTAISAKLHNVKSIIFSGSMAKYRLIRELLERYLLVDILMNNLKGGPLIKLHFLHHPGFVCALGVWWKNVDEEKERRQKKLKESVE